MKKGLTSLDAITAFIILLFLIIFIQKTTSVNLSISDDYAGLMQAKSTSEEISSLMNTFYATTPGINDKIIKVNDSINIKFFGDFPFTFEVKKQADKYKINTTIRTNEKNYSVSYPVVNEIKFIQSSGEITK